MPRRSTHAQHEQHRGCFAEREADSLAGQGGMADVANMHANFLLYLTRHSPMTLVERVDYISAARGLLTDDERIVA